MVLPTLDPARMSEGPRAYMEDRKTLGLQPLRAVECDGSLLTFPRSFRKADHRERHHARVPAEDQRTELGWLWRAKGRETRTRRVDVGARLLDLVSESREAVGGDVARGGLGNHSTDGCAIYNTDAWAAGAEQYKDAGLILKLLAAMRKDEIESCSNMLFWAISGRQSARS